MNMMAIGAHTRKAISCAPINMVASSHRGSFITESTSPTGLGSSTLVGLPNSPNLGLARATAKRLAQKCGPGRIGIDRHRRSKVVAQLRYMIRHAPCPAAAAQCRVLPMSCSLEGMRKWCEAASSRSTAALANDVSEMRTPASDCRRVIVATAELLIACLARARAPDALRITACPGRGTTPGVTTLARACGDVTLSCCTPPSGRPTRVSPGLPGLAFQHAVPTILADRDRCICRFLPCPTRPSPFSQRVGIRINAVETCSGFTHITARWIAQPPKPGSVSVAVRVTPLSRKRRPACFGRPL